MSLRIRARLGTTANFCRVVVLQLRVAPRTESLIPTPRIHTPLHPLSLVARIPKPETRNPRTETRNPRTEIRNPKPEDRNPSPYKVGATAVAPYPQSQIPNFISQKVFIKSFGKSQFTHKSVNLSFIITNIKNKLTDSCGH